MNARISFFADYEELVLRVARVVLIVLASVSFLAVPAVLVWLGFTLSKPAEMNYKQILYVPTFDSMDIRWNSSPRVRRDSASTTKIPPVLLETIDTIDTLYQLVGRDEQKFSEMYDLQEFYLLLIEPFAEFDEPNTYDIDFLLELNGFTESMAQNELLKRIADADSRSTTIIETMLQFRDEYLINLDGALASIASQSSAHGWNRMVTSLLVLQTLSVCITIFVVSTVCLLGFHVGLKRRGLESTPTTSTLSDE